MDFDKIVFMHWYIWSMLWLIHIIFLNFSIELWPLIDFRIMFMLNILWNNWWIWSNLVITLISFMQNMCNNKNKHSGGVSCSACNAFITIYGHGGHLGHVTWTIWANFRCPIPFRLHMKFGFNRPSGFSGKEVWKCWHWVTLDQGHWMTLTFDIHICSCTHLVNFIYQLWHHRLQ